MSTTDQSRTMTAQQLIEAVDKAIHFSNSMDCVARRPIVAANFERQWARLGAFLTSLSMTLDEVSPGLFAKIAEFQEDVAYERNPMLDAAASKEQGQ
ncbi:hypothetical protein [Massilia sp. TN1-12]|uniref:hypothetical protein n=1 Tax=Massilia paldalensis TaxID=3377675 RepID=UPI003850CEB1